MLKSIPIPPENPVSSGGIGIPLEPTAGIREAVVFSFIKSYKKVLPFLIFSIKIKLADCYYNLTRRLNNVYKKH